MLVDFHSMLFLDGEYRKFVISSERTTSAGIKPNQRSEDHSEGGRIRTHLQFREFEPTDSVLDRRDHSLRRKSNSHARASAPEERQPKPDVQFL